MNVHVVEKRTASGQRCPEAIRKEGQAELLRLPREPRGGGGNPWAQRQCGVFREPPATVYIPDTHSRT